MTTEYCKYCNKKEIEDLPFEDWKLAISLYKSYIEPLEKWVEMKKGDRQWANSTIEEHKDFPNRDYSIEDYTVKIIHGTEDIMNESHACSVLFKVTSTTDKEDEERYNKEHSELEEEVKKATENGDEEEIRNAMLASSKHKSSNELDKNLLAMTYECRYSFTRFFTYKGISFRYGNCLEDTLPKGVLDLKNGEIFKYNDSHKEYTNWIVYKRIISIETDPTIYQIMGWNDKDYSLFFTA